ncbi:GTP binding domain,P-loop containing nucleoside triphosphate hydrolase [Cinara cedri]|uniref:Guanine nucleotide-binding protein-like 1 n=1 Tax=Cinara cedri TaxID=506608 RepID=A0A5E4N1K9_9HEMI|nr:GTP binding domain,P-loop containing nucleoside triphosphate hydrolase [Cinara cedri]
MPQGRRKLPFSGKQKKLQIQEKRKRKQLNATSGSEYGYERTEKNNVKLPRERLPNFDIQSINQQPLHCGGRSNPNQYVLQFRRETEDEMKKRKEDARKEIIPVSEQELEFDPSPFFCGDELRFPIRPKWSSAMTREQLDSREYGYFKDYLLTLKKRNDFDELSYFELNLETWRQMWRVMEMSDILVWIADARYPAVPTYLFTYVLKTLKKSLIIILNKVDLVPSAIALAWKDKIIQTHNLDDGDKAKVHVLFFTSYTNSSEFKEGIQKKKPRGKLKMAAEAAESLLIECKSIIEKYQAKIDLQSWEKKISEEKELVYDNEEDVEIEEKIIAVPDTSYEHSDLFQNNYLTIGLLGQPNAGKSSVLNALMGKKVVSVSRTPGHTKHFQTIFLTPNVRLCDCPGLVFPSKLPKPLQVLMGCYPIAQLREPYSSIKFLAERLNLVKLLNLQHPEPGENEWSAIDICDSWAIKRGFITARAGRPDTYRAANNLLRMALDGKICLVLRPYGFTVNKKNWSSSVLLKDIWKVKGIVDEPETYEHNYVELSSDDEPEQIKQISSYSSSSEKEDSDDQSSDSDNAEVCGAIVSNKFSALDVSE